jgi:hypothetical protein
MTEVNNAASVMRRNEQAPVTINYYANYYKAAVRRTLFTVGQIHECLGQRSLVTR